MTKFALLTRVRDLAAQVRFIGSFNKSLGVEAEIFEQQIAAVENEVAAAIDDLMAGRYKNFNSATWRSMNPSKTAPVVDPVQEIRRTF